MSTATKITLKSFGDYSDDLLPYKVVANRLVNEQTDRQTGCGSTKSSLEQVTVPAVCSGQLSSVPVTGSE